MIHADSGIFDVGPGATPPEQMERERDIETAWRAGQLWWKLDAHQLEIYHAFHDWNQRRQTEDYAALVVAREATLDDVWVEEIARRFGKTSKWIVMLAELAIQRPGSVFTYGCAWQKDIGEIIVPLSKLLLGDGPEEVSPEYRGSSGENHQGLYFPNGSLIKLVGVDVHPDALRGRFSDAVVLSEAGFIKNLEDTVRAVLLPQFQRRPWAFLALESSTPKQPDHDFERVFVHDARKRDAYVMRTIDANAALSERDKAKYLRQSGGRGHPVCEREYYCVKTRDPGQVVIPEFNEAEHVREHQRPMYARCLVAADPGSRDLFALVFGYYDFLSACGVIERSWAKRNASTKEVACVTALYEHELWGKWPAYKTRSIPLHASDGIQGWCDLLTGEADREQCEHLRDMANTPLDQRPPERWPELRPADRFVYWDGVEFRQNPALRTTDVDLRFVRDLVIEYDLAFSPTAKDDADAQRNNLRDAIGSGKLTFLPGAGPVIQHVNNAIWNEKRTDYERHKVFGHYDCLAALVYWWRNTPRNENPAPPQYIGMDRERQFKSPFVQQEKSEAVLVAERLLVPQRNSNGRREGWRARR